MSLEDDLYDEGMTASPNVASVLGPNWILQRYRNHNDPGPVAVFEANGPAYLTPAVCRSLAMVLEKYAEEG